MRTALRSFVPVTSLFDSLEPRQLLAATFTGTDTDGDQFTIKLTGSGSFTQTLSAGGTGFIQSLALTGTDAASKLSITVKRVGNGDGRVILDQFSALDLKSISAPKVDLAENADFVTGAIAQLDIGDMFDGAGLSLGGTSVSKTVINVRFTESDNAINAGSHITSLNFAGTDGSVELHLPNGIDRVTSKSSLTLILQLGANAGPTLSIKSITAKGALVLISDQAFDHIGDIGSITAGFITNETDLNVQGVIGSITTSGAIQSISGIIQAGRITKIETRGSVNNAAFFLRTPDANNFTVGSFKAGAVTGSTFNVAGGGVLGVIKKLDVASWSGGSIFARGITTLLSKGDFRTDLFLQSGAGLAQTINTAVIKGQLVGTWSVAAPIKSITARGTGSGMTDTFILTKPNQQGLTLDLKTLSFTGTDAVNVTLDGGTLGTISAKGDLDAVIAARQQDASGRSIGSISARQLSMEITDETVGGIGKITARSMNETLITAAWINTLSITGGAGVLGSMTDTSIKLTGADTGGFSLRKLTVAEAISGTGGILASQIGTAKAIGSITAKSLNSTAIWAGNANAEPGFPANLTGFTNTGSSIASVTLTRPFTDGLNFALANSYVIARTISKITVSGRIDTDNSSFPFGFGGQTISNVTLKNTTGVTVKPLIANTPQDVAPFASNADFIFRVFA